MNRYVITILISAMLLFMVQPMISKVVLPHLGGSPSVWNLSMFFFQSLLLAGYAYVHFSLKWLGYKKQALLHICVIILASLFMPLSLHIPDISPSHHSAVWLLQSLFFTVGLPFFLLSTTAPLVQFWYARSGREDADNPYYLYAASNAGSLGALVGYILLIEPFTGISEQMTYWSVGFVALALLLVWLTWNARSKAVPMDGVQDVSVAEDEPHPTWARRFSWIGLAFLPSALMLAVTHYITTDIASAPLLWVIPLILYLITFIIAFGNQGQEMLERCSRGYAVLALALVVTFAVRYMFGIQVFMLHLFLFFACAMICHGRLAVSKPSPRYLTEFYLYLSIGGMLGGLFNSFVAPEFFHNSQEYWVLLALVGLVRLSEVTAPEVLGKRAWFYLRWPLLFVVVLAALHVFEGTILTALALIAGKLEGVEPSAIAVLPYVVLVVIFGFLSYRNAFTFVIMGAVGFLLYTSPYSRWYDASYDHKAHEKTVEILKQRDFFGTNMVLHHADENLYTFKHGTTIHGMQLRDGVNDQQALTYYPDVVDAIKAGGFHRNGPIAIVGLGAGSLLSLGAENQEIDVFEISPTVVEIASNPDYFTFVSDSPAAINMVVGDGRLKLSERGDNRYGLIVIDAFSSDAIPAHLLTTEAMALYLSKLKEGGVIAINFSNRFFDLAPVISRVTAVQGAVGYAARLGNEANHPAAMAPYAKAAFWALIAKDKATLTSLESNAAWHAFAADDSIPLWTDDHSNILSALKLGRMTESE